MLPSSFKEDNLTVAQKANSGCLIFNIHWEWEYLSPVVGLHGHIAAKEYTDLLKYEMHSTVQTMIPWEDPINPRCYCLHSYG